MAEPGTELVPGPEPESEADQYTRLVVEPLASVRDFLYARRVVRRDRTAGLLQRQVEADLGIAYRHRSMIRRGERL